MACRLTIVWYLDRGAIIRTHDALTQVAASPVPPPAPKQPGAHNLVHLIVSASRTHTRLFKDGRIYVEYRRPVLGSPLRQQLSPRTLLLLIRPQTHNCQSLGLTEPGLSAAAALRRHEVLDRFDGFRSLQDVEPYRREHRRRLLGTIPPPHISSTPGQILSPCVSGFDGWFKRN
eukprot:768739-Hanusia_phi.AAC.9